MEAEKHPLGAVGATCANARVCPGVGGLGPDEHLRDSLRQFTLNVRKGQALARKNAELARREAVSGPALQEDGAQARLEAMKSDAGHRTDEDLGAAKVRNTETPLSFYPFECRLGFSMRQGIADA